MLFSEIYGCYFQVVASILEEAAAGTLTPQSLTRTVRRKAFAESVLSIPAALKKEAWPLLTPDLHTPLKHRPTMPLTTLQKRWMKALLLDPRIALFQPDPSGLEEVEPLFRPETFLFFDRYADGDPYEDPVYRACFSQILQALREGRRIRLSLAGHGGRLRSFSCIPRCLEYSAKDDKFRLLTLGNRQFQTVNLARLRVCTLMDPYDPDAVRIPPLSLKTLTLLLREERNALERALLHFSHFEKETLCLEEGRYQITLRYDREDEAELLIRVLSFGPMLEVKSPPAFRSLVVSRLAEQAALLREKGR